MHEQSEDGHAGASRRNAVFPIPSGWVLNQVCRIDAVAPGFMRQMCRARLKWRQACWAALSMGAIDSPDFHVQATGSADGHDMMSPADLIREFAEISVTMSARQIIEATFPTCPDGYLGVLGKLHGEAPSDPGFYSRLHAVFTSDDPLDRLLAKALQQVAGLGETKIEAAFALQDAAFLTPLALSRFHSVQSALRVEAQAKAVRSLNPRLSDDDISAAFAAGRDGFQPWFHRLLLKSKADFALPTDVDPDFVRIDGDNAKAIGEVMENCLDVEKVLPRSLSGIWSLVHWRPENIVVALRKFDLGCADGWALTEVHLAKNSVVSRADVQRVADRVRPLGILCPVPCDPDPQLQDLSGAFGGWKIGDIWDFGDDWD